MPQIWRTGLFWAGLALVVLVTLFVLLQPFAYRVGAAPTLANAASALPFGIPGFEPQLQNQIIVVQPAPALSSNCAVSADQLPPDFVKLMTRLDAPTNAMEISLPPVVAEIAPAAVRPRDRPARPQNARRGETVHGIQILNGGGSSQVGTTRENGVTVYRGMEPDKRSQR